MRELRKLINKLGIAPADLLRKGERVYRDLGLAKRDVSDEELIRLMVENPDLIQRPIVVRGEKAVLSTSCCEWLDSSFRFLIQGFSPTKNF